MAIKIGAAVEHGLMQTLVKLRAVADRGAGRAGTWFGLRTAPARRRTAINEFMFGNSGWSDRLLSQAAFTLTFRNWVMNSTRDEHLAPFAAGLAAVRGLLSESPMTIADLGCGAGGSTTLLAHEWPSATVTGYDREARLVRAARQTSSSEHVTFVRSSLSADSAPERVDLVTTLNFLSHPPVVTSRLRPGGHYLSASSFEPIGATFELWSAIWRDHGLLAIAQASVGSGSYTVFRYQPA